MNDYPVAKIANDYLVRVQSAFGGDGLRSDSATDSVHIVLRSDGTFEGHIACEITCTGEP
jgi:hypothetical protein